MENRNFASVDAFKNDQITKSTNYIVGGTTKETGAGTRHVGDQDINYSWDCQASNGDFVSEYNGFKYYKDWAASVDGKKWLEEHA